METFKKPDLNGPRYRPMKLNLLNKQFCNTLKKEQPQLAKYSNERIKEVINAFNEKLTDTAVNDRDGVMLPEMLGSIFLATCPRPKKSRNINFKESIAAGIVIPYKNSNTDDNLCKIFYTNYEQKYRFTFSEMWEFNAQKEFRIKSSAAYAKNWNRYVKVDNYLAISKMFRKNKKLLRLHNENLNKTT